MPSHRPKHIFTRLSTNVILQVIHNRGQTVRLGSPEFLRKNHRMSIPLPEKSYFYPMATTRKIFVLDTSVILYDHNALNNFQEHDVAIPIQVLEELDNMKGGNETRNFEAREFIRLIDGLSGKRLINQWVYLNGKANGRFRVILPGHRLL